MPNSPETTSTSPISLPSLATSCARHLLPFWLSPSSWASPSGRPARGAPQLEEIGKNGAILLEMVDNVLECARIQAGSETLNLELVDLNDLVGMVESAMAPGGRQKRA